MQINLSTLKITLPSALIGLLLISCGTHNQNDYADTDGIYNSSTPVAVEETNDGPSNSYYGQYFNSKTNAYQDLPEEGAIFTDIDAYSTTDSLDEDGYIVTEERTAEENYGGWGENSDNVTVNVYGGNNWGNNWGAWNRPYWWYGSGFGFYNNWCSPYYGIGWGWGYPFYGYYGWGYPNYYGGYYNNFYNPYYGNAHNGYAYTRGRRNSDYYNGRTAANRSNFDYRDARNGRSIARQTDRARNNSSLTDRNNRFDRSTSPRTARARNSYTRPSSRGTRTTRSTRPSSRGISRPSSRRSTTNRPSNSRTTRPSSTRRSSNRSNTRSYSPSRSSRSSSTRSSSRGGGRSSGVSRGGSRRGGRN